MDVDEDSIFTVLGFLPDCRAAAVVSKIWYNAYTRTADFQVWVAKNAAFVTAKMYPGVWKKSVYELVEAGNYSMILRVRDMLRGQFNYDEYRTCMNISKHVIRKFVAGGGIAEVNFLRDLHDAELLHRPLLKQIGLYGNIDLIQHFPEFTVKDYISSATYYNLPTLKWLVSMGHRNHVLYILRQGDIKPAQFYTAESLEFLNELGVLNDHYYGILTTKNITLFELYEKLGGRMLVTTTWLCMCLIVNDNIDVLNWLKSRSLTPAECGNLTLYESISLGGGDMESVIKYQKLCRAEWLVYVSVGKIIKEIPAESVDLEIMCKNAVTRRSAELLNWLNTYYSDENIANELSKFIWQIDNPIVTGWIPARILGLITHSRIDFDTNSVAFAREFKVVCHLAGCDYAVKNCACILPDILEIIRDFGRLDLMLQIIKTKSHKQIPESRQ